ncbi:hypothetical protein C7212DRAFT_231997 [Tuber magnatum]|uniref:Uncharacterized protein n=1 Tax=Tuber magnatum TaxID=42249 RepID=A0A317SB45_9PEZI|nr:hypothetical protein C7212DRAFT_231979 [Tuber magnatum]PWW71695.1 hypothetical protein C7212DRAFT_231997 [Tuber magnatum]
MQSIGILTVFTLLFAALAIAAPVVVERQITPTGFNKYGDDGIASKTDGSGEVVPVVPGTAKGVSGSPN